MESSPFECEREASLTIWPVDWINCGDNWSCCILQRQLFMVVPGMFSLASDPRPRKSCIGATARSAALDSASRISSDLVKVNWLRDNPRWTESKLYYLFLWTTIVSGSVLLVVVDYFGDNVGALVYFKLAAAMNGGTDG